MASAPAPLPHAIVLYDGACAFCVRSVQRLRRFVPRAAIEYRSFRDEGALDGLAGVSAEACDRALHLLEVDGRVFVGAEAIVRVLAHRAIFFFTWIYYVPPIRWITNVVYGRIARNRFRRTCEGGDCGLPSKD
jgi:predicted DCC family thiol-disulfide oxidoreductase YuxK